MPNYCSFLICLCDLSVKLKWLFNKISFPNYYNIKDVKFHKVIAMTRGKSSPSEFSSDNQVEQLLKVFKGIWKGR